ncbi:Hypothetical protein PHPALM_4633 [Phytophthora palmivora]|uniref:Uncharacterized protein n=1 Tax=Phytophthora palmivora TaxID=4796 RepID=A0A2P4YJD1_9STRA|nr:Hypothetical protein PHPALM_4633 [Phytophthora palmivora]
MEDFTTQNVNENGEYTYPENYDVSSYTDYYYEQQDGGENYYASYQQDGYEGYYSQQDATQDGNDPYQYQYNFDPNTGSYDETQGQDYNYYYGSEEYGAEQQMNVQETWGYTPEEGQQLYLDQLTTEQVDGYYYDEYGNLIDGDRGEESPTNAFNQEAYWESGHDSTAILYSEDTRLTGEDTPQDEIDAEDLGPMDSTLIDSAQKTVATPEKKAKKMDKNDRAVSPSRKKKTKKERIEQRQAMLEKEEEERLKAQEDAETASGNINASGGGTASIIKTSKLSKKKTGIVGREKAKFQLKLRIAKAIKRNRMPVQIRILPTIRKHLSPMDKYFGSKSVECVLSDIFWSSMKGDIGRVKHLVEIEGESPTDSKLDPWNGSERWVGTSRELFVGIRRQSEVFRRKRKLTSVTLMQASFYYMHRMRRTFTCRITTYYLSSLFTYSISNSNSSHVWYDQQGAMCPLDWVNVRGHTKLLKAIEKYQDSLWLPKFVDDLIRGIVRYKIKLFKDPPKKHTKGVSNDSTVSVGANSDIGTISNSPSAETEKPTDKRSPASDGTSAIEGSTITSLLERSNTEKV